MLLQSVFFGLGVVGLVYGAEWLVTGSANVARAAGISQLVIGLTVVAIGTSTPELVVSIIAATAGKTDVAIGNVVGSNIANLGLILGATAMVRAVPVQRGTLMKDGSVMILAAIAVTVFAFDAQIGRLDGIVLLIGCAAYLGFLMRSALQPPAMAQEEIEVFAPPGVPPPRTTRDVLRILGGIAGLVVGGRLLILSAVYFAHAVGVSDLVIGLTVVAIGTSLPELATSVLAAIRGHSDLALGNVIGSNVLNLFLILGTTALIRPLPAQPSMLTFEIPVMLGVSILLVPLAWRGRRITRWKGALLVLGYFAFLAIVVIKSWPGTG